MSRPAVPDLAKVATLALVALGSLGGSCRTPTGEGDASVPPKAAAAPAPAAAPSEAQLADKLPGVDLQGLDARGRAALLSVAQDALCNCGRPTTLAGCLREQPDCVLGQRMGLLAKELIVMGASPLEATDLVENYFDGFRPARRASIELGAAACQGPADAPVTLVEFADFECPYCSFAFALVHDVVEATGGKVRWCYLHFPLGQHENARLAAQVAEAAKAKGKFFEVAQRMYEGQQDLGREQLLTYAAAAGLDAGEVAKALEDPVLDAEVERQRREGEKAGVEGTPTLFLNGRRFVLPLNGPLLVHAIEDELIWQSRGRSWGNAQPGPDAPAKEGSQ